LTTRSRRRFFVSARRAVGEPHLPLALAVVVVLVLEGLRGRATFATSAAWPIAQAIVAGVALALAWVSRDRLRLGPVLLLSLLFDVAWIVLHLRLGVAGDHDPIDVYPAQGNELLHGHYPHSEYPPGAVGLFALETWLGGGTARTANAFIMVPFQLVCVAGIWALRTRWSAWLATFVALWPLNAFYWEFRFDLVPTAALVAGVLLARNERWLEAGLALGLGAVVKWTPALTVLALTLWLLRSTRVRAAGWHIVGFAIPVLLANLPLLIWQKSELTAAYTTQTARTVTAESFVYLPLHFLWNAEPGYWYFGAADVPPEANRAAVWFQALAVLVAVAVAALARTRSSATAAAALTPAVFFLTNRIFSPQFFVLVLAAVAVAAALLVEHRGELLCIVAACAVSTTANTVLFQSLLGAEPVATVPSWMAISTAAFVPVVLATIWLFVRTLRRAPESPLAERRTAVAM
jgi:hypothetical protein